VIPASLPIDPLLPKVVSHLGQEGALVLQAEPGAGKTTRVPRAVLESRWAQSGEILVQQPRRLATRLAAQRVAAELGEPLGRTVGYAVRFEEKGSRETRLRFITEGILLRRLVADPQLQGVSCVIFDEFHERHLVSDVAIGLVAELRRTTRPDLAVCVMSATLDAQPVSAFLDDCPTLSCPGRTFPVTVSYEPFDSQNRTDDPLAKSAAGAVRQLVREGAGDVLVFLPGAAEIRRVSQALHAHPAGAPGLVLPLHGEMPPSEQDKAVRRAAQTKIILSTNVAETSVTIPGVAAVVDSGLARVATHSPWSGLQSLSVEPISQASAIQRAGRAGRTQAGRAVRLYSQHDFESRPAFDVPEVARLDLSEALLSLAVAGVKDIKSWNWLERPPDSALATATNLLKRLGAVGASGAVTELGGRLGRMPLHPRLARVVAEGCLRGIGHAAADMAALLAERDIRASGRTRFGTSARVASIDTADGLEILDRFWQARARGFSHAALRGLDLDAKTTQAVARSSQQLHRFVPSKKGSTRLDADERDRRVAACVLAGFPDRVGKRRQPVGAAAPQGGPSSGREHNADKSTSLVLSGGGAAQIGSQPQAPLVVATNVVTPSRGGNNRGGTSARQIARVTMAVPISADDLLDVAPDGLAEEERWIFNTRSERVERQSRLLYGAVVLEESVVPAKPGEAQATLALLDAVREHGLEVVLGAEQYAAMQRLQARLLSLRENGFSDVPAFNDESVLDVLENLAAQATSFSDLRAARVIETWFNQLEVPQRKILSQAPEDIRLPGGRRATINYESGKAPWIASRLQDFFGLKTGPRVLGDRVPLTLHLLAPNKRAVQVTSDLTSFWKLHYPTLRKQLQRRYPKHHWPEEGATATPPPSGRLRPP